MILGFVVADPKSSCSPSWGGFYSLNAAADQLNLDRRVAQLQNEGASAVVSFGGQANNELAVSCTDTAKLTSAYESVIKRYSLTTIDLDIEGARPGRPGVARAPGAGHRDGAEGGARGEVAAARVADAAGRSPTACRATA